MWHICTPDISAVLFVPIFFPSDIFIGSDFSLRSGQPRIDYTLS